MYQIFVPIQYQHTEIEIQDAKIYNMRSSWPRCIIDNVTVFLTAFGGSHLLHDPNDIYLGILQEVELADI